MIESKIFNSQQLQFALVCLAIRQVTSAPPPFAPCNLHYFTEWGTVSWAPVTYENQAILFCFAATLHGSSHSTGYRRKRTTMFVASGVCIPGMFLYVGTVYHAVQATV